MRSDISLLVKLASVGLSFIAFSALAQQQQQWQYWAQWDTATIFSNEKDAAAHMRAGPNSKDQYLTVRGEVNSMGTTNYRREWTAPPVPPNQGAWKYRSCGAGTNWYTTEQEAKDVCLNDVRSGSTPCASLAEFDGEGAWNETSVYLGLYARNKSKIYYIQQWGYALYPEPHCFENQNHSGYTLWAERTVQCPSGYSGSVPLQACEMTYTSHTYGKLVICSPTAGNPCDTANGSKLIREVDYSGPGIQLTRVFNSQAANGWSHNYSGYLAVNGSNSLYGAITPDGFHEPLKRIGIVANRTYVSYTGSGVEARGANGNTEWALSYPSGAKDYFNLDGELLRRSTATGQVTTVTRDSFDRIATVVGPFGHTLTFAYVGTSNLLESVTDPAGEEITYSYDGDRLTTVTYQDGTERSYLYEDPDYPRFITGITDENGARYATYAYDSDGRVVASEHAGGSGGVSLTYAANSTTVVDANFNSRELTFTTDATLLKKVVSETVGGTTRSYVYPTWAADNQQRPTQVTDENGVVSKFTYDTHHKTAETRAFGTAEARTTNFYYLDDTTQRLTRVTSPSVKSAQLREVETTYTSGLPTTIETSGYTPSGTAVSRSTTLTYNSYGQVTQINGPRTDVTDTTTFDYYECTTGDECGQLESVTNALGHVTTYHAYDDHGRVLELTDANGVVTEYTYDERGRTTSVTATPPGGTARVSTYVYDDAGQLVSAEAPNGTILTYEYDDAHNLLSITDNLGNSIEYGYDLNGNRTSEDTRDPSSNLRKTVEFTYDARNRVESINAAGSITDQVFDALGNLTDETDPNSNDTDHDYDPLNRLAQTIDALSGITEYGYDQNDQLTSVEAPNGATTTYVYDDLGNLLSLTSPDTGTTTYTYDAAGNRLSQTDANSVTVAYAYDALNRLTSIDYPGSTLDVAMSYDQGTDQKGRLTAMTDGGGSTTFEYDAFGNLTEEAKTIGANTHVTAYAYDEADLVTSITYPSGRTVDYTRNVLGQITTVASSYGGTSATLASGATYEPFGPLKGLTFGNSLVLARTFDEQYRLTDQTTGSVQDLSFTLDDAGNIDAISDAVSSGLSQGFAQDALHRVTTDAGSYGTKSYTFDGVGNRLTRVHGATTQTLTYAASSNRLATHDGQTVTLDATGHTTANPAENLSFTYGAHQRLLEAYVGGVLKATYVYDGRGQRVKKIEATGAQRTFIYHYGLGGELLGETVYSSAGAKIGERDYVWLDTLPVAQSERSFSGGSVTSSQLVHLHADQLNTPRLATNGSGTVVWRWDSDAFGVGTANEDPDADTNLVNVRLRFPGQYHDEETGLHYNFFRTYDSAIGRYVESDPVGLRGGLNTYGYVYQSPLRYADPFGLDTCEYAGRQIMSVIDTITAVYEPVFEIEQVGPGPRNTVIADCAPPLEQPRDTRGRLRAIKYPCIPMPFDVPWLYRFGIYRITSYDDKLARIQDVYRCVDGCGVEYLYKQNEHVERVSRRVIDARYGYKFEAERL